MKEANIYVKVERIADPSIVLYEGIRHTGTLEEMQQLLRAYWRTGDYYNRGCAFGTRWIDRYDFVFGFRTILTLRKGGKQ